MPIVPRRPVSAQAITTCPTTPWPKHCPRSVETAQVWFHADKKAIAEAILLLSKMGKAKQVTAVAGLNGSSRPLKSLPMAASRCRSHLTLPDGPDRCRPSTRRSSIPVKQKESPDCRASLVRMLSWNQRVSCSHNTSSTIGSPLSIEVTQKAPISVSGVMTHHCHQLKPRSR